MFADRADAGRQLAERLAHLRGQDLAVLGLPRGGVPVAWPVAEAVGAPLDVLIVRKLGVPARPELAMGALGEDGVRVLNDEVLRQARVTPDELREVERHEQLQLRRRVERFRTGRPRMDLTGRLAVIVDDGLATGSTARAACLVARRLGATRVVLAVPVAPAAALDTVPEADEVVWLQAPQRFAAVGLFYRDFTPTTDQEVVVLLDSATRRTLDDSPPGGT